MNFVLKMLVAKYGEKVARVLYEKYKEERRKRDNRTAEQYQKTWKKDTGKWENEAF